MEMSGSSAGSSPNSGIGVLNEHPLHASLKEWYAKPGDRFEVPLDGYIIDIVRDGLLIEVQTGNFTAIRSKLRELVRNYRIRLIYPVAYEKWLLKRKNDENDGTNRRKSPKRGRVEELFGELVSFPHLLIHPHFSLEVVLIQEEEVRRYVGRKRNWRRRGWAVEERRLLEVLDRRLFEHTTDLLALLPKHLGPSFTTNDIAERLDMRIALARKMAYCLRNADVIELVGKRGRAHLYQVADRNAGTEVER